MIFLLDSNAIRDLMDDHPRTTANLTSARSSDRVVLCSIVAGEILFGIERIPPGRRRDRLSQRAAAVFAALSEHSIPFATAAIYSRIKRERETHGRAMDENDLWIAATAIELGATLVTRDRDFANVANLAIQDWTL